MRGSALSLFVIVVLAAQPAFAQRGARRQSAAEREARAQARTHFQEGTRHYNLGQFEEALADYTHAYEAFPSPLLLFNIGQCHRALHNHERAVFFLEGFLRESDESATEQRALAEELLAESRTALESERNRASAQAPPEEETPSRAARDAAHLEEATPTPVRSVPVYEEAWFWVVIGLVVVGAAAGVTVGVLVDQANQLPAGSLGTVSWR